MEYKVVLDSFEGPLDLLLHLIEKEKVDIYDIPIARITDQYVKYIRNMEKLDLNLTSEFLVMAATLLEIKSKMLLPNNKKEDEQLELEEADPREALVKRLLEYKKYKLAAEKLKVREQVHSKVFFKQKEEVEEFFDQDSFELDKIDFDKLLIAYNAILKRCNETANRVDLTEIQRDEITIEDCMDDLLNTIKEKQEIDIFSIFEENLTKVRIIVIFLSLLELIKLKIIKVVQKENFGNIIIKINKSMDKTRGD